MDLIGTTQEKARAFAARARDDNRWAFNEVIRFLMQQKERVERREITGVTDRNYLKQEFSAMHECPLCNFRDANPSNITDHLKSGHNQKNSV